MISQGELMRAAEATGFQPEPLERVALLFEMLESLHSHPFLKQRIVLKGGTALNAFVLPLPRLSVDIDLNYIGSGDREVMLAERPKVKQTIEAVCARHELPYANAIMAIYLYGFSTYRLNQSRRRSCAGSA